MQDSIVATETSSSFLPNYKAPKKDWRFVMVYVALVILSLHWSLVIYINSSFLGKFVDASNISMLYGVGSVAALMCFFYMPSFLRSVGNYKLTILLSILEILALVGMALANSAATATFYFLVHFILVPLILFNLDVFIEALIGTQENNTGSMRGLYLSLLSLATAAGPLLTGNLIHTGSTSFAPAYFASALLLIPFILIISYNFRTFADPEYVRLSLRSMAEVFKTSINTRNIVCVSLFLQIFFTWMTIYTPLYLAHVAGFSWHEIGIILFVALSAYVLFEYPIGIIADRYIGEKEMMIFGFILLIASSSWLAFLPGSSISVWMIVLFLTRTGASFVEATSESYFFKHTQSMDVHKISLFRMTRPLSSVIAAVVGSIALLYMEFNMLFILLGLLLIPGLFFSFLIKDTK
jgi:predicted MFS family arabinose efflux permease